MNVKEIYDFVVANRKSLLEYERQLYFDDNTGYAVYVNVVVDNPLCAEFIVTDELDDQIVAFQGETRSEIEEAYKKALSEAGFFETFEDLKLEAASRDAELNEYAENLICSILSDDIDSVENKTIEEAAITIKEVVCEILANQFNMPIYRPLELVKEDDDHNIVHFIEDYPYPLLRKTPEKAPE